MVWQRLAPKVEVKLWLGSFRKFRCTCVLRNYLLPPGRGQRTTSIVGVHTRAPKTQPYMTETVASERKGRTRRAILDAALAPVGGHQPGGPVAAPGRQGGGDRPHRVLPPLRLHRGLGLALVDESFVSLRAMLRDVRRGDPRSRTSSTVRSRCWSSTSGAAATLRVHRPRTHRRAPHRARRRSGRGSSCSSGNWPRTWPACPAPTLVGRRSPDRRQLDRERHGRDRRGL